jgi:hypothetical protein
LIHYKLPTMDKINTSNSAIQDIFIGSAESYLKKYPIVKQQRKAVYSIMNCRGPLMGKHIDKCDRCGHLEISYNSCRNRHCPKCQASKQQAWVNQLEAALPPVRYFHLVFTLPHELNELVYQYQQLLYPLLFKASAKTVLQVASRPGFLGAQTGCLSILHTWGQNMLYHPHIHMLVPSGGLSEDLLEWIPAGKKFFAPVKVLSKVFRGKFISMLEELIDMGKIQFDLSALKNQLYKKDWVVYSKKTFAGPGQVLQYMGRYTHRVAISNERVISYDLQKVSFRWKDYREGARWKIMQVDSLEFIRRFLLHVLPANFYKIRYYGIFSLANRNQKLKYCFNLVRQSNFKIPDRVTSGANRMIDHFVYRTCPVCQVGSLRFCTLLLPGRGKYA